MNGTDSEICINCNECCRWMSFTLNPPNAVAEGELAHYYTLHGCKIVRVVGQQRMFVVMVPCICRQLGDDGRCAVYEERPDLCRNYDGRQDPLMRKYCRLPKARSNHGG